MNAALKKVVCKSKMPVIHVEGKRKFTTHVNFQLDSGATCNVMSLDDLSTITQMGEPPLNKTSVKGPEVQSQDSSSGQ